MNSHVRTAAACAMVALFSGRAMVHAQVGPDGIDWVTIGAVNNPAYDGEDPFNRVRGRGSVGYEYKIGRFEVTSSQWGEFFAAALNRPDGPIPWVQRATQIGTGMAPVGGVSWRTCAIYANWLHNNKSSDRTAFLNGAYDVSTFGNRPGPSGESVFTDQLTHNPGARYWIPTLDEWLKAAHFSPTGNGGQGQWFLYPTGSDTPPRYGPPPGFQGGSPLNQANSGFSNLPGRDEFRIPLGAYSTTSPWGLFDTAGATSEWLEYAAAEPGMLPVGRYAKGSAWAGGGEGHDRIYSFGGGFPDNTLYDQGLRLASAVPVPGGLLVLGAWGTILCRRKRTGASHERQDQSVRHLRGSRLGGGRGLGK